jgi:hypothetical protein
VSNDNEKKSFHTATTFNKKHNGNMNINSESIQHTPIDSVRSNKTQATKRTIPKNTTSGVKSIQEIIKSCKTKETKPKDKFIKFGK